MEAKNLEVGGRTFYAFEEPDFVGPMPIEREPEVRAKREISISAVDDYITSAKVVSTRHRVVFGFLLPLICIYFDPFVFKTWGNGPGVLGAFTLFAYGLSATTILSFVAWHFWGDRLGGNGNAAIAGLFYGASAISLLIGIFLFPFSLIGTVMVVGFLGFTPIAMSVLLFKSARQALDTAKRQIEVRTASYIAFISALASIVVPWIINQNLNPLADRLFYLP